MKFQRIISNCFGFIRDEWIKRPLFYSVLIFSIIFLFSRLISLFIPYVEITYDSLEYVNYIDSFIAKGQLPPTDFLPLGYPIILKVLSLLHDSVYPVIILQNIFTWFACLLVIIATEKRYPLKSIFVLIPLCIFVLSAKNLFYDITIITESFYASSLIIIASMLILALHSSKKRDWVLLSISLFPPILFRPNGVFTIVIYLIVLLYCLFKIKKKELVTSFALPYLSLLLIMAVYSVIASNSFTITSPKRLQGELNTKLEMAEGEQIELGKDCLCLEKPSLRKAIKQYYYFKGYHTFNPKLKNIYEKYHRFHWPANLNYGSPEATYEADMNKVYTEKEKEKAFKEFYHPSFVEAIELRAQEYRKTIFFKAYDWYQLNIHRILFATLLWPIIFFISFFIGLFQLFRNRLISRDYLIFVLLCLINIGTNMIHIITTHRTLARYEYPGEFLYYLAPFFLIICFIHAKQQNNSRSNSGI